MRAPETQESERHRLLTEAAKHLTTPQLKTLDAELGTNMGALIDLEHIESGEPQAAAAVGSQSSRHEGP